MTNQLKINAVVSGGASGLGEATVKKIIELGKEVERSVLARAVKWHLEDRIFIVGNKTIVFN